MTRSATAEGKDPSAPVPIVPVPGMRRPHEWNELWSPGHAGAQAGGRASTWAAWSAAPPTPIAPLEPWLFSGGSPSPSPSVKGDPETVPFAFPLLRLNPTIAALPDRADEVLYRLRAIVLSVRSDGLIKANEEMNAWLRGERSMPFGENHEHVTIRVLDLDNPENNHWVVTSQFVCRAGPAERRADLVLLVNGLPLVVIECKTPVRPAVSWVDGAVQIHEDYERHVPELFVANVLSVATEGKELRYGAVRMPLQLWGPWRTDETAPTGTLAEVAKAARGLLQPRVLLDILGHFTLFATDKKKRRIKLDPVRKASARGRGVGVGALRLTDHRLGQARGPDGRGKCAYLASACRETSSTPR